jgi:hypothetical protein
MIYALRAKGFVISEVVFGMTSGSVPRVSSTDKTAFVFDI